METLASLNDIRTYFGMNGAEFRKEWSALSVKDKADLKRGIGNGTLTY